MSTTLSAIVGTSVFSAMARPVSNAQLTATGLLSVLAALLTALHTFLDYPKRAQSHAEAATVFGALRRKLELLVVSGSDHETTQEEMIAINSEWKLLDKTAPPMPQRQHDWVKKRILPGSPTHASTQE